MHDEVAAWAASIPDTTPASAGAKERAYRAAELLKEAHQLVGPGPGVKQAGRWTGWLVPLAIVVAGGGGGLLVRYLVGRY